MSPVVLSLPDSVERFHKFIFADPTSRAPYLYGLSVSPDLYYAANDDPRFADCLVAILEAAVHLEYLYFPTTIGLPICAAVTKLTTLRELIVYSNSHSHPQHQPEAALNNLLAALKSPLQHLCVIDYERGQISASILHDHLFHFAPTLESLTVEDFPFDISPPSVTTSFTALRSLTINAMPYQPHFCRLDVLLRLFPNLDGTLFLNRFMPPVDQHSALREQNKEAQREYTWRRLDRVIGSAELAFTMALRCPIRCMDIDGTVLQASASLHLPERS
ncbi:hypothetical protein V8D89_007943 [Ganoderma adspersum]